MKNCKYWIILIFSMMISCSLRHPARKEVEAHYCMSLIEYHALIVKRYIMLCEKNPNEKCVNKTEAYADMLESFNKICKEDYSQQ